MQVAALRGQVAMINARLDQAGIDADVNLAARFEDLAQTVTNALEAAGPRGPAAPYWIGLDRDTFDARLAGSSNSHDDTGPLIVRNTVASITSSPRGRGHPPSRVVSSHASREFFRST
jgi:hypothetical protein